ncbi:MAG: hypothetical protein NUV93_02935 [Firmicutes bacterium]|nr:hypothetical protein [Bacillota bacterium]
MKRHSLATAVDLGSTIAKAALVRRGRRAFRVIPRGYAPVYDEEQSCRTALVEALGMGVMSGTPTGPLTENGWTGPVAMTSTLGGPVRVLAAGWRGSAVESAAGTLLAGTGCVVTGWAGAADAAERPPRPTPGCGRNAPDLLLCLGPPVSHKSFHPSWFIPFTERVSGRPVLYDGEPGGFGFLKARLGERGVAWARDGRALAEATGKVRVARAAGAFEGILEHLAGVSAGAEPWRLVAPDDAIEKFLGVLVRDGFDRVAYLDVGSSMTRLVASGRDGSRARFTAPVGTGRGAASALDLESGGAADPELEDWAANRASRPWSVPDTPGDLARERRVALACARHAFHSCSMRGMRFPPEERSLVVVGGGTFRFTGDWAVQLDLFVGALKPVGVFRFAVDAACAAMHVGAVVSAFGTEPGAAPGGAFESLADVGQVVAVRPGCDGEAARLEVEGLGEFEVRAGSVVSLPLPLGRKSRAKVVPLRGADAGAGPGESADFEVVGGLSGLVIDARVVN